MSDNAEIITAGAQAHARVDFTSEAELEKAVVELAPALFGPNRIYLDTKKALATHHGKKSIPDGYLLDLSGHRPRLYVVENELATHEPLKHIAVQLLQFSLAFDDSRTAVKEIVFESLKRQNEVDRVEAHAKATGFRNIDHIIHSLVNDEPFRALVVIDQIPDGLERSLTEKFGFSVEIIELAHYVSETGEHVYRFIPFLSELVPTAVSSRNEVGKVYDVDEVDTIVVPAREDGFLETFMGENRWYKIRIGGTMRSQIRYIAVYRVAPLSAITHIAEIGSIQPWEDSGKYVLNFKHPAEEIGPIKLAPNGRVKQLLSIRYATRASLERAKTLDEVW